ncbi:MAG TPA: hypothetical protein VJU77_07725 [Chthoniobacterales bacterium]|nr:hypothetical protein [Chthoniobacterales bacterium]
MVTKILARLALLMAATCALGAPTAPVPDLKAAEVTLPYPELKALWQAAQHETPERRKPPVESALLSARYQVALKGEVAAGVVEYEIESFTDEWITIPLLGAITQVDEVEPVDVQLIVRENHYALVTNRPGKQKLRLRFAVKLNGATEGARFVLEAAPAAINTLSVTGLPEKQTLRIPDATQLSAEKDRITYRLPARERIEFELVPEKPVTPPILSRWNLDAQALVSFAEGKLNYEGRLAANTDNGSGLTMELELPAGFEVTKVTGADLDHWRVSKAENQARRLHLRWQTRDVLRRQVEIAYGAPQSLTGKEWNLKAPRLLDGENNPPLFAVVTEPGLELSGTAQGAGPRQLPAWMLKKVEGKTSLIVLGDAPLAAKWLPLVETAQAVVETANAKTRIVSDGALLTEVDYSIRHERALRWSVDLPEGSELLAAKIDGQPVKPIDRGERVLEFALPAAKQVSAVSLSYTAKKPAFKPVSGQVAVELPQTDLLVHWLDWELRIPVAYEVAAFEGNVESTPCDKTDATSRAIPLHKELCKNERPRAEFFYQKPHPNK